MATLSEDLRFRGLIHQVSGDDVLSALDGGGLTVYVGFDPTATSLHIGNLLQLCTLRRLQLAGHRPLVVAGGATGMIGDPGGKSEERVLLDRDAVARNLAGIRPQLERFLDFTGPVAARLVDNADWLGGMSLIEFLRDVGKHFTVNQMVAKDSVRARFERPDQGISFTEFSYMLLQAYDYLHLHDTFGCALQMGASDQWGNITMGIDLIRRVRGAHVHALTTPLVVKADGTKFGKSESGALYLDAELTTPYALYQYFVRSEDEMVGAYLRFFTFLARDDIESLDAETTLHPERRAAQRRLAAEVVALVHGDDERRRVERAVDALYSESVESLDAATLLMVLADAPATQLSRDDLGEGRVDLVDVLVSSGLAKSKNVARQVLGQGGVYVNNRRVDVPALRDDMLIAGRFVLLRRGRRDLHLLEFV